MTYRQGIHDHSSLSSLSLIPTLGFLYFNSCAILNILAENVTKSIYTIKLKVETRKVFKKQSLESYKEDRGEGIIWYYFTINVKHMAQSSERGHPSNPNS